MARETVDSYQRLDVREEAREARLCPLRPGLDFVSGWLGNVPYRVELEHEPCHFGGSRPWFLCPLCRHRCGVLFAVRGELACRHCHGLVYPSQRESASSRAYRRRDRIVARHRIERYPWGFPKKPPRMWWRTFERLLAEIRAAEAEGLAGAARWLSRR